MQPSARPAFCVYGGDWERYGQMWLTWWLGDAVGILVFVSLCLTWEKRGSFGRGKKKIVEASALLVLLALVEVVVFFFGFPLEYQVFPVLFWTAFRFGQFETAVAVTLIMLSFLAWTVTGVGPFTGGTLNFSLLFLQSYLGVAFASTLILLTLIKARNRTEEALRASEEKFRSIFENAPVGIFQSTVDGRFSGVNETLAAMFGYASPKEMIGNVSDIAGQLFKLPDQMRVIVSKACESSGFVREEIAYRRRDVTEFVANLYMRLLRDGDGKAASLEGFVEDISERKRAEDSLLAYRNNLEEMVMARTIELQETNERLTREVEERARAEQRLIEHEAQYHDLVESANCVILRWLPDGRIIFFNRFAQSFFGYEPEEILGRNIAETIIPRGMNSRPWRRTSLTIRMPMPAT